MPGFVATTGRDSDPGNQHELWLAMQAAHQRHTNAAMAGDAQEQRAAFEAYIEARLQLSECLASRPNVGPERAAPEAASGFSWSGVTRVGMVYLGILAIFLLPASFGLGYLVHERRLSRDPELPHKDDAKLGQVLLQVQTLAQQVEALTAANRAPAIQTASVPAPPAAAGKAAVRRTDAGVKAEARVTRVARNHDELVQLQKRGERNYREFAMTLGKRPERIGPVAVTVLKVDPERKYLDLSIAAESLAPTRKRVGLNQQVWIDLRGRPKSVELVINRVDRGKMLGYVSEPKYRYSSVLQAPPQSVPGL